VHQEVVDLVRQAQAGNWNAFSSLYEIYFNRVYCYMMARVAATAEAEDLTQELFLKVMISLKNFRFKGPPFDAWLFTIARNLVIDWIRRNSTSRGKVPLEEIMELNGKQNVEMDSLLGIDHQKILRQWGV
jgi:RNA polymerase sigma-70 factor (ECF subfamily)